MRRKSCRKWHKNREKFSRKRKWNKSRKRKKR